MLGTYEPMEPIYRIQLDRLTMDWDILMNGLPTPENVKQYVNRFSDGGKLKFNLVQVVETKTGKVIQLLREKNL